MECDLLELYKEQDKLDEIEYIQMEYMKHKSIYNLGKCELLYLSDHDIEDDDVEYNIKDDKDKRKTNKRINSDKTNIDSYKKRKMC